MLGVELSLSLSLHIVTPNPISGYINDDLLLINARVDPLRRRRWRQTMHPPGTYVFARTVVAPPLSVVKCLWEVFVWGSYRARVCAGVGGVSLSVRPVCV